MRPARLIVGGLALNDWAATSGKATAYQKGLVFMDIRQINDEYSVTGQITPDDVAEIKALGFKSIVCHRPDGEAPDQPAFDDVKAQAESLGLEIRQVPFGAEGVTETKVQAFVDALDEMPRPMLGYCRSGARSTKIYELTRHIRN
jgi:uncharacterized protein (TIGR01244 family)